MEEVEVVFALVEVVHHGTVLVEEPGEEDLVDSVSEEEAAEVLEAEQGLVFCQDIAVVEATPAAVAAVECLQTGNTPSHPAVACQHCCCR